MQTSWISGKYSLNIMMGQYEDRNSTILCRLPNEPACFTKVLNASRRQEMADTRCMNTLNDYKLLQISWIFDVDFGATFREVLKREYVDRIFATLPETKEIREVVATVLSYLLKRQPTRRAF
jgi:hypothetical protein